MKKFCLLVALVFFFFGMVMVTPAFSYSLVNPQDDGTWPDNPTTQLNEIEPPNTSSPEAEGIWLAALLSISPTDPSLEFLGKDELDFENGVWEYQEEDNWYSMDAVDWTYVVLKLSGTYYALERESDDGLNLDISGICNDLGLSNIDIGALSHADYFGTAPVPEPATMLLLGTGLIGLVGFSRKFIRS